MKILDQFDPGLHAEVCQFLYRESELLDDYRLKDWQEQCIDPAIQYVIPVRQTLMKEDGLGFCDVTHLQSDDWNALTMRIKRFDSKFAWSENPATRVRHFVTNVRVGAKQMVGAAANHFEVTVKSNVLVYRSRGSSPEHELLSAERIDVLRNLDGDLKLTRREVRLDCTVVGTHNFSFFF